MEGSRLKANMDLKGECLDSIFRLVPGKAESTAAYTGRAKAAFAKATSLSVSFSGNAQGYIILRPTKLSGERQAVLLSLAKGEWKIDETISGLNSAYPRNLPDPTGKSFWWSEQEDGKPQSSRFNLESLEAASTLSTAATENPHNEVVEFLTETAVDDAIHTLWHYTATTNSDLVEETVALDCYATWADARRRISAQKLKRKFPRGAPMAQDVGKRTRSWNCGKAADIL